MGLSLFVHKVQSVSIQIEALLFFLLINSMNLGLVFLEAISTGVITSDEMYWVTSNQPHFSRVEEATALKLGRLLDRGLIQIGCRIGNN
mgnify:CR=1 FL=1